jgi:SAM-dependent methyltransferase
MILNLGSGKDWMRDAINADINPAKNPDWVLDITKVPWGERISTRHGEHLVEPGMFEVIIANDVLEHIPDLVTAMTNCKELLHEDGEFHIHVPYDLSYGAWQDPTHVRAFNEKSFLYYGDWHWYVGWKDRFYLQSMEFELSDIGVKMAQEEGLDINQLAVVPRAIDAMRIVLTKKP